MASSTAKASRSAKIVPLETGDGPIGKVLRVATEPVPSSDPRPAVDEWGRDAKFVDAFAAIARLRWDVSVGGQQLLPKGGPALIVINTRPLALTPVLTALALSEALDRPVRFVGRPDVVPFGPLLRRIGGLLAIPEEVGGALRAGELVLMGAEATRNPRHAGKVDHQLVAAAIREQAPVHVAATLSTMFSRNARIEVTAALRSGRNRRRGPLADIELAEQAQRRLQDLLDEIGGTRTGVPVLGWFGEG